ncbi:MAG: rubredoxin [Cyanobacteria bacterium P01_D01_bin.73]
MTQPDADPPVNSQSPSDDTSTNGAAGAAPDLKAGLEEALLDLPQSGESQPDNAKPKYTGPQPILSTNEPVLSPALNRYECKACGYIYEPQLGDSQGKIPKDTAFVNISADWRCAVCGTKKSSFVNIGPGGQPSGFDENLGYGMGVNTLSPAAKNLLIFGSLAAALALMLSLYGLQ